MGKVLRNFTNGWPGAVSRSTDNVIVALRNGSGGEIPFGVPVFLVPGENACRTFLDGTTTSEQFLGFSVRAADKTPETYGSSEAVYLSGDPVEVLVRGSTVLDIEDNAAPGNGVYLRKSDGRLVSAAGAEGTTLQLPNVTVRNACDSNYRVEVVVTKRNVL